jgi:hypothetical protein
LNPTIDFSDLYNIRFGNPGLTASLAHNFDLVLGKNKNGFYANLALGYKIVQDIFSQVRTLLTNDKTQTTWLNISSRKEYEVSTWSGYTLNKKVRINLSASYIYNTYSDFDKQIRNYRNGGSLTSNLNANYTIKDLYTAIGSFTFNHFTNPQGIARGTLSMNIGLQAKMLSKKLILILNIIDPFVQQQYNTVTYGTNFILNNYSLTQTRNFRLTVAYNFYKSTRNKVKTNNTQILNKALSVN